MREGGPRGTGNSGAPGLAHGRCEVGPGTRATPGGGVLRRKRRQEAGGPCYAPEGSAVWAGVSSKGAPAACPPDGSSTRAAPVSGPPPPFCFNPHPQQAFYSPYASLHILTQDGKVPQQAQRRPPPQRGRQQHVRGAEAVAHQDLPLPQPRLQHAGQVREALAGALRLGRQALGLGAQAGVLGDGRQHRLQGGHAEHHPLVVLAALRRAHGRSQPLLRVLVRQVLEDGRGLEEDVPAVLQRRHRAQRVHPEVLGPLVLSLGQVQRHQLIGDAQLLQHPASSIQHPAGTGGTRLRGEVELHRRRVSEVWRWSRRALPSRGAPPAPRFSAIRPASGKIGSGHTSRSRHPRHSAPLHTDS